VTDAHGWRMARRTSTRMWGRARRVERRGRARAWVALGWDEIGARSSVCRRYRLFVAREAMLVLCAGVTVAGQPLSGRTTVVERS
jgi:hypothetical protein